MKKLIVSGCSYTAKDYISSGHPEMDCSWPKWPQLLAKKLDMQPVNLAYNGAGNRFILQTLLEAIERTPKEEIGMVVAAWSQANRDDWLEYWRRGSNLKPIRFNNERFIKGFKWENTRINRPGIIFGWVRETLLGYITLQNVCKRYDIPLIQFQMISLYEGWTDGLERLEKDKLAGLPKYEYKGDMRADRKQIRLHIKEYEQFINHNTFLGYEKTNDFHGDDLNDKISPPLWAGISDDNDIYKISKLDEHPNAKGQEKIAEIIYDWMG